MPRNEATRARARGEAARPTVAVEWERLPALPHPPAAEKPGRTHDTPPARPATTHTLPLPRCASPFSPPLVPTRHPRLASTTTTACETTHDISSTFEHPAAALKEHGLRRASAHRLEPPRLIASSPRARRASSPGVEGQLVRAVGLAGRVLPPWDCAGVRWSTTFPAAVATDLASEVLDPHRARVRGRRYQQKLRHPSGLVADPSRPLQTIARPLDDPADDLDLDLDHPPGPSPPSPDLPPSRECHEHRPRPSFSCTIRPRPTTGRRARAPERDEPPCLLSSGTLAPLASSTNDARTIEASRRPVRPNCNMVRPSLLGHLA